jgi:hypothetical protein
LERSKGEVKVFISDCFKNGHSIEEGHYSHRTISLREILKDDSEINKRVNERVIIKPDLNKRPSQIEPNKLKI